jgi:hypothetical protein
MNRRRLLSVATAFVAAILGMFVLVGVAVLVLASAGNRSMAEVERHLAAHAKELSASVAELASVHPSGGRISRSELPPPLQAPGVQGAFVGEQHITLYVHYTPDTDRGFRVWAEAPSDDYIDDATPIPGVYQFRYCDDHPESSTNRPD